MPSLIPVLSGPSAYDVAVENGFTGTEAEWLASLQAASKPDIGEIRYFTEPPTQAGWLACDFRKYWRWEWPEYESLRTEPGLGASRFSATRRSENYIAGALSGLQPANGGFYSWGLATYDGTIPSIPSSSGYYQRLTKVDSELRLVAASQWRPVPRADTYTFFTARLIPTGFGVGAVTDPWLGDGPNAWTLSWDGQNGGEERVGPHPGFLEAPDPNVVGNIGTHYIAANGSSNSYPVASTRTVLRVSLESDWTAEAALDVFNSELPVGEVIPSWDRIDGYNNGYYPLGGRGVTRDIEITDGGRFYGYDNVKNLYTRHASIQKVQNPPYKYLLVALREKTPVEAGFEDQSAGYGTLEYYGDAPHPKAKFFDNGMLFGWNVLLFSAGRDEFGVLSGVDKSELEVFKGAAAFPALYLGGESIQAFGPFPAFFGVEDSWEFGQFRCSYAGRIFTDSRTFNAPGMDRVLDARPYVYAGRRRADYALRAGIGKVLQAAAGKHLRTGRRTIQALRTTAGKLLLTGGVSPKYINTGT